VSEPPVEPLLQQRRIPAHGTCFAAGDDDFELPRKVPAMPARSFASVTISFGLVAIPVDVYSAEIASSRLSFNMLHAKDGARIKQQYVCALDGEVVDRSEIVKGYEYEKDQYVMFKPEEIKALEEAGSKAVNITEFVPLDTVDPVYFDRTYLLAPSKQGGKPYALLNEAMRQTKLCAVGRWATRGREYIVVVRPLEDGMAMHQLHFKDEVRTVRELGMADAPQIAAGELKLAKALIEQSTAKRFDPSEFHDEFRARVDAAIEKKVKSGKEISHFETEDSHASHSAGNVVDLMEVLQRSLNGGKGAASARSGSSAKTSTRKPPRRVGTATRARAASRGA
jgi:DNA end-binding protein Ku